ncbi:MAG: alanine--glyoxylate aminotransferase family protein [Candidatus Margulisiibacteriota bacterium]|jgi:aspartate aminotransferase-like enzyme
MANLKQFLMIPGPTQVPENVALQGAHGMINHRSADFKKVFESVIAGVKELYLTKNDLFIFNSSGTGALEAAVSNIVGPGDKVVGVSIGNFGERFQKIAKAFGGEVIPLDFAWGTAADPKKLKEILDADTKKEIKAVLMTQNETSTGVVNDIKALAEVVRAHGALIVVDAVSGLLAEPLKVDEWGLDIVASGSQKAFMVPPGLGILSVSAKAWKVIETTKRHCYYFDLLQWKKFAPNGETPWTPALSLFFQMDEALKMLRAEGIDKILARHQLLKKAARSAARALGFGLLAEDDKCASPAVTAIVPPAEVDAEALRKLCRTKYGVTLAGGQGKLAGKIFRISHLGYIDQLDIISAFAAIEMAMSELGQKVVLGSSVKAIQEVLLKG